MATCDCPQMTVVVVMSQPIACIHKRKARVKEQKTVAADKAKKVCEVCLSQMAAQDDGWQIDTIGGPTCACA